MSEADIVSLLFDRSEEGLKILNEKYGKEMYSICYNATGNREDAKECVNDAILACWNTIPPNKPDNLKAYVLKIARNISINRAIHEKRKKRDSRYDKCLDEISEIVTGGDIAKELDRKEIASAINGFLGSCSKEERQLFVLRYWKMESFDEISKRTNIRSGVLRTRMCRLRKELQTYLSERGIDL